MLTQLSSATINGVASGMAIFMMASGITLIFGILKILNFSHGAFFMLGAYITYSIVGDTPPSLVLLITASLVGGLAVALCGFVTEKLVFQRLRGVGEHYVLIATFALLLVVTGATRLIWGVGYYLVNPPVSLDGAVQLFGAFIPAYSLFIVGAGIVVFLALEVGVHRTSIGKVVQALRYDSWIINLFGYNVPALYTATVVIAFFLAGAAGGLLLPNQSLSPSLGDSYLIFGFVTCILGGLGSVRGAFLAALLLGVTESLSSALLNTFSGLTVYLAMIVVLLVRPQGISGAVVDAAPSGGRWRGWLPFEPKAVTRLIALAGRSASPLSNLGSSDGEDLRLSDRTRPVLLSLVGTSLIVIGLSLPFWANAGLVFIAGQTIIEMLFALSWHLLFGYTGIVSFGHAAFFAIGAYGVGGLLKLTTVPFLLTLLAALVGGGAVAAVVALIALRRSTGIYLAILTMALAEIFRLVVSHSSLLGRDDGMSNITRPLINLGVVTIDLGRDVNYYWFLWAVALVVTAIMWWIAYSRVGRTLRSILQDPERSSFLGIDVGSYKRRAFIFSGAIASLAGGLSAPWTQIVTPDTTNLVHSTAPILNTLLGGASSFWGPFLGSIAFSAIEYATRRLAGLSEIVIGVVLLIIVTSAPTGIAGLIDNIEQGFRSWLRRKRTLRPAKLSVKEVGR